MRISARLNDTTYLVGTNHVITIQRGAASEQRQFEDVAGIMFSPRGDRAILRYAWSEVNGVPVFGAHGDTAFSLHDAVYSAGGGFTPDGDTLFLAVYGGSRLVRLNAVTGERLGEITLPFEPEDVAVHPSAPWVYVFGWTRDSTRTTAYVAAVRRNDLSIAAILEAPGEFWSATEPCFICKNTIYIDPGSHTLYVLGVQSYERVGRTTPAPTSISSRFELLP